MSSPTAFAVTGFIAWTLALLVLIKRIEGLPIFGRLMRVALVPQRTAVTLRFAAPALQIAIAVIWVWQLLAG